MFSALKNFTISYKEYSPIADYMNQKIPIPRGTHDILPEEISTWQDLEQKSRKLLELFDYQEIRTPIFEETALFSRSLGQTTDIVQKQMLNLEKDGLSLRPEGTASIVRAYIENSIDKKINLAKLYYLGPMFRGERPQKGRLRQFHQIGVEAIGPDTASPYLDAEVIGLSAHLLKSFGLKNFILKINTLGSVDDKENFSKKLRQELKPKIEELCEDCRQRFERNVFRILDCKNKKCMAMVAELKIGHGYLSDESQKYFSQVKEALDDLGIPYEEAHSLVRGLDYYTHTIFEISDSSLGSQNALGAGGRYNHLVSQLGGSEVDAIGFALGIERILLAMPKAEQEKRPSLKSYIIALDEHSLRKAFQILAGLRDKEIRSAMSYRIASMKSQMRLADKTGARFVIIIGENEFKKECVSVKDMQTGTQEEISIKNNDLSLLVAKLI